MKFKVKTKPKVGSVRIQEGFLFFPKKIDNEWRWFEYAIWEEIFKRGHERFYWSATQWLNDKPKKKKK